MKKVCYGGPNTWHRYYGCQVDKCGYEEFYDPPHSARMQTFVSVLWASRKVVGRDYATTRTKLRAVEAENEHRQMQATVAMRKEEMQAAVTQYYRRLVCYAWMVVAAIAMMLGMYLLSLKN